MKGAAGRPRPHGADGFSTIEMIVTLALMAMISGLLVSAIQHASQTLKTAERQTSVAGVEAARRAISAMIAQTQPRAVPSTEAAPDLSFLGERQRLRLTTGHMPPGQYAGLHAVAFTIEGGPQFKRLLLQQSLHRSWLTRPATEPIETVLIDKITDLSIRYFGSYEEHEAPAWRDSWRHPMRLPRLVQLDVAFEADDPRRWPSLVVALALAD